MKFKFRSWHLVLFGILAQASFGLVLLAGARNADSWAGLAIALIGLVVLFTSALGVIPLLLLLFAKTRTIGAVVSIVFGIIGITARGAGAIVGIFLIIAGILALWKKI